VTKSPTVRVQAADLKGETPAAIRDSLDSFELVIDFSWPPAAIAACLETLFQDGVDSERWSRNDTRPPHPGDGLD
jgi:hypothetical protein